GRADVRAGLRYGAGAFGVVLLVLVVAATLPAVNGFLHDSRAQIGGGRLLYELGVSIVLLTAIPEGCAFRGVRLGAGLGAWEPGAREPDQLGAVRSLAHRAGLAHDVGQPRGGRRLRQRRRPGAAGAQLGCRYVRRRSGLLLAQVAVQEPDRPGDGARRDQR